MVSDSNAEIAAHLGFAEVRLQPSPACRAWISDRGCVDAGHWESVVAELSWREGFEAARLRISAALAGDGIDPLGITRKLLVHEASGSIGRGWLRETGFVHLEAASGIHLYALWRAYDALLFRFAARVRPALLRPLRIGVPLASWFVLFALTGFRPGLLRPLALVGMRWCANAFGLRWARLVPILVALGGDAVLALALSHGRAREFGDWAPGELHYALSWWGGILGYDWARARGWGSLASHAALSVASWLAVLPLDWAEGRFSAWTPLFSLLTVEFLARGGFAAAFVLALAVGIGGGELATEGLAWFSALWNRGIGELAAFATARGAIRLVDPGAALFGAVAFGVAFAAVATLGARERLNDRIQWFGPKRR